MRRSVRVRAVVAATILAVVASAGVTASGAVADTPPARVVVLLKDGLSARANARKDGAMPRDVYSSSVSGYSATVTAAQRTSIAADPDVQMVVPDVRFAAVPGHPRNAANRLGDRRPAPGSGPDDTLNDYPITQYYQIVPTDVARVGTSRSRTAAIDGHNVYTRASVAVLDSGIQTDNPELHVVGGHNCSTGDPDDYSDVAGHGTEVAGVLAAEDNVYGIAGVAPGASLYSVRVLDADIGGELSNIICGVDWVTAHANVIQVANMSLSAPGVDDHACGLRNHDALHLAICKSVLLGRVTYVVGAGNDSADASTVVPAAYNEVITVSGSTDTDGLTGGKGGPCASDGLGLPDDAFAFFSNSGRDVDVAAVANCVLTTYDDGGAVFDAGTSFAAPAVAGAAALLLSKNPYLTPLQVKARILAARERTHLAGDPDGIDEGVLDVSGF